MEGDTGAAEGKSKLQTLFARLLPNRLKTVWLAVAQTLGPVLIVSAIVIFSALHFVRPAPPNTLTIASGAPGSKFNLVAQQYQKILARNGITLKIVATEGFSGQSESNVGCRFALWTSPWCSQASRIPATPAI